MTLVVAGVCWDPARVDVSICTRRVPSCVRLGREPVTRRRRVSAVTGTVR